MSEVIVTTYPTSYSAHKDIEPAASPEAIKAAERELRGLVLDKVQELGKRPHTPRGCSWQLEIDGKTITRVEYEVLA